MKQQREHWGSRLGFIMAAAGSAIGLGSLWRFPYMAGQNGGGAFVLLYLLFTFFVALPVFWAELVIGRHAQRGAVGAFSNLSHHSHHWKLLGWFNVLTSFLILTYYCVVAGWCVNYALMSLSNFTKGRTPEQIRDIFDTLYKSPDIQYFWFLVFVLMNVGVVYGGIRKGIEYWSKILTPALLFLLIGLFFYSMTLSGFGEAFKFIFYPKLSQLSASGILNALGMSFFTLSVGLGIIITYGSYMKESEDIPKTGFIVGSMTVLISIMAALMIFPIIFTFGFAPEAGAGLVFKTLPVLFAQVPGTLVLSTVFFILMVFTALTSTISLIEVLVATLMENLSWTRARSIFVIAGAILVCGIPAALSGSKALFGNWTILYGKDYFDTINDLTGSWMLPIAALMTTIFIGWFMDKRVSQQEFLKGTSLGKLLKIWFFVIRWIVPVAILLVILHEGGVIDMNRLFAVT
jgi:neurotransmitter:Na+ symporter, NSS family